MWQNHQVLLHLRVGGADEILDKIVKGECPNVVFMGGAILAPKNEETEIKLNQEVRMRLGQSRCYTDLYYKQAKITEKQKAG